MTTIFRMTSLIANGKAFTTGTPATACTGAAGTGAHEIRLMAYPLIQVPVTRRQRVSFLLECSSKVEHPAVNRRVVGSTPPPPFQLARKGVCACGVNGKHGCLPSSG